MDAPADKPASKHEDLEIKDAQLIFGRVWAALEAEYGRERLLFPKEIIWLGGAPGAGKGTNTPYILEARDITAEPIVVSALLDSPAARKIKDAGGLVGDEQVVGILLRALLEPAYQRGAVIDGFPRTQVQVSCLKMFYDGMIELRNEFLQTPRAEDFPQPLFHSVLLFVDEEESVERQLKRGREALENNKKVDSSGVGSRDEVRQTDLDADAARRRYRVFKETTYDALQSLREIFHFHFIDAEAPLEEVQEKITQEVAYQSSLELERRTYDRIHGIPLASQIVRHARQELVQRLEGYNRSNPKLFERVVAVIQERFIPIIQRYTITGLSLINSEDPIFEEPQALAILIDIFSERGYQMVVDVNLVDVPDRFDPETGRIHCRQKRVYRFQVRFAASAIRRGSEIQ